MTHIIPGKAKADTRIVVAMSGGVDSSTVAALMVEEGYDVVGITLQLYDHGQALQKKGACCAGQDIEDARAVAERLDIPHYVLNYESLFKEAVIDEFADSYIRGETPIPCVRCNQTVKFRDLFGVAKSLEADALVTGHYVQRKAGIHHAELHRGEDSNKDQSYFLFATTQEQLDYLHFPLGNMTKDETRAQALRFDLPVADKPDSQDICFVPNGSYSTLVQKLRPEGWVEGDIMHVDGRHMGRHNGIANFTIGQRKGLGLSHHETMYVVNIDPDTNCVLIGPESALFEETCTLKAINWLGDTPLNAEGMKLQVKLRSAHDPVDATLTQQDDNIIVTLHQPQKSITPGQACVFYDGSRVLGGGWITRT